MRIGICAPPDQAEAVARCGFDYIECAAGCFSPLSVQEIKSVKRKIDQTGLVCEAVNCLIPGSFQLASSDVDWQECRRYLVCLFERLAMLDVRIAVFGSGAARQISPTQIFVQGKAQLHYFVQMLAQTAADYSICVALEPLNLKECNVWNTVEEAAALVREIHHPNFQLLLDTYHYYFEGEPMTKILQWKQELVHFHIARPVARSIPSPDDKWDYTPFFDALREINYDGRISIEAKPGSEWEMAAACAYLKHLSGAAETDHRQGGLAR